MPCISIHTPVSCVECSYWEALYNWQGHERGGICHNNEEYEFKPLVGSLNDMACHSHYEHLEVTYDNELD